VIQRVDALRYVSDQTAEHYDAVVDGLFAPSADVPFIGIVVLEDSTSVEIKAAQRHLASGRRGRFFIRERQHGWLLEDAGAYLFAVYDPREHRVLAMTALAATTLDGALPEGWTSVEGDRAETGYRQLSWSRVIDPDRVERNGGRV
jgi:hypothetical protein